MVSRAALIDRILQEPSPSEASSSSKTALTWTDFDQFEEDNLSEVDQKLHSIDNEVWAKLVVMERGTRTVKAYLRNSTLLVDGTSSDFDGTRLGLRGFRNANRQADTELSLRSMGKGLEVAVDAMGNVLVASFGRSRAVVESQGKRFHVGQTLEKIFDLRRFRDSLSNSSASSSNDLIKQKKSAIIKIQLSPCATPLECPLWLCIINVIAMEMTTMLSCNSLPSTSGSITSNSSDTPPTPPPPCTLPGWSETVDQPREFHFYEQCTRNGEMEQKPEISTKEHNYTVPETKPNLKPSSMRSSISSPSLASLTQPIPSPRIPRFIPNEKEVNSRYRGGVKKRLERDKSVHSSAGSSSTDSPHSAAVLGRQLSSSIIDLRTLSQLRRPVYFEKPLSNRGGTGHLAT